NYGDPHHLLPIGHRRLLDTLVREIVGVVDQDIDAAETFDGGFGDLGGAGVLRNIGDRQNGFGAQISNLLYRRLSGGLADVIEHQTSAFFGETDSDGFADASAHTGDDGDLPGKARHQN